MFAGDDFKMSGKGLQALGKPPILVRSDTALAFYSQVRLFRPMGGARDFVWEQSRGIAICPHELVV